MDPILSTRNFDFDAPQSMAFMVMVWKLEAAEKSLQEVERALSNKSERDPFDGQASGCIEEKTELTYLGGVPYHPPQKTMADFRIRLGSKMPLHPSKLPQYPGREKSLQLN